MKFALPAPDEVLASKRRTSEPLSTALGLRLAAWLLEYLDLGLVAVNQPCLQQQVDGRLN